MAHPCKYCGSDCGCWGDIDDTIIHPTPDNCQSCGCGDMGDDFDGLDDNFPVCGREYDAIDREFQICSHCQSEQQQATETE